MKGLRYTGDLSLQPNGIGFREKRENEVVCRFVVGTAGVILQPYGDWFKGYGEKTILYDVVVFDRSRGLGSLLRRCSQEQL